MDKGYDNPTGHQAVSIHGYLGHIRQIGEENLNARGEKRFPGRRWAVERTLAGLSRCRASLVPYDKKVPNYIRLIQLACSLPWYRRQWQLKFWDSFLVIIHSPDAARVARVILQPLPARRTAGGG